MSGKKVAVAVLVSGGGTNLQAILDAEKRGELPHAEVKAVVSSRADAGRSRTPSRAWGRRSSCSRGS